MRQKFIILKAVDNCLDKAMEDITNQANLIHPEIDMIGSLSLIKENKDGKIFYTILMPLCYTELDY